MKINRTESGEYCWPVKASQISRHLRKDRKEIKM